MLLHLYYCCFCYLFVFSSASSVFQFLTTKRFSLWNTPPLHNEPSSSEFISLILLKRFWAFYCLVLSSADKKMPDQRTSYNLDYRTDYSLGCRTDYMLGCRTDYCLDYRTYNSLHYRKDYSLF